MGEVRQERSRKGYMEAGGEGYMGEGYMDTRDTRRADGGEEDAPCEKQQELELGVSYHQSTVAALNSAGDDVVQRSGDARARQVDDKLTRLNARWRLVCADVAARKELFERSEQWGEEELTEQLNDLVRWLDETEALLFSQVAPGDEEGLENLLEGVKEKEHELGERKQEFVSVEQRGWQVVREGRLPNPIDTLQTATSRTQSPLRANKRSVPTPAPLLVAGEVSCLHLRAQALSTLHRDGGATERRVHALPHVPGGAEELVVWVGATKSLLGDARQGAPRPANPATDDADDMVRHRSER
ncbi:PREDICTED: dystrophin-like [Priapulus caudatus]|uniref:Dystrophin-like n=1 Tax=Priapulus caudatus TaxID=37621 RepID=A0ABM1F5Y2_PRICU|nr:PREDICTED: dystrophin-like [Priapulus caudatus]